MTSRSTCSYTYETLSHTEPSSEVPLPRVEPSHCPHTAGEGNDERCLFHSAEREFPPDAISSALLDAVNSPDRPAVFAGGRIGKLDLSGRVLATPDGSPIDLRGATIDGTLNLRDATIKVPLLIGNAAITGALDAKGAQFDAPLSLAGADIGGKLNFHDTIINGGIAANNLSAGFVDARGLTVHGATTFQHASFNANTRFSRTTFDGNVSFANANWRLLADFASTRITGTATFHRATIGGEFRLNSAALEDGIDLSKCTVSDDASFCHAVVDGVLNASQTTFDGDADFEDLRCTGPRTQADEATFNGHTSFSLSEFDGVVSLTNTSFLDEAWFTHAIFNDSVNLSGSRAENFIHLRDSTFNDDLSLADVEFEHQSFLHGSTIQGGVDATDATFDHFQFSATVHGDTDFRGSRFDGRGIFSNSEFGGRAWFDTASFAGGPDFSDCRFKQRVTFDDAEFLVEPTFDDARFAVNPDFEAANYPQSSSMNLSESRRNLIVARPEDLRNSGFTVPVEAMNGDIIIPAEATNLLQVPVSRAKVVTAVLNGLDQPDWYSRFKRSVELARTAVSELNVDRGSHAEVVFGLTLNKDGDDPASFLSAATLVGAYTTDADETEFTFSYLNPELSDIDHFITVSIHDDAFESGASVGSHMEYRKALFRRQLLEQTLLEQGEASSKYSRDALPALVGIARLSGS